MAIFIQAQMKDGKSLEFEITCKIFIGRSSSCTITFAEDLMMSSKHGMLEVGQNGCVTYTDIGSRHGSSINGNHVLTSTLKIGEVLKLGETIFSIVKEKLTPAELLAMTNTDVTHTRAEEATTLITSSSLIARPQFEKKVQEKMPSLAERWSESFEITDCDPTLIKIEPVDKVEKKPTASDYAPPVEPPSEIKKSQKTKIYDNTSLQLEAKKVLPKKKSKA